MKFKYSVRNIDDIEVKKIRKLMNIIGKKIEKFIDI
jgi:hypothetical protein